MSGWVRITSTSTSTLAMVASTRNYFKKPLRSLHQNPPSASASILLKHPNPSTSPQRLEHQRSLDELLGKDESLQSLDYFQVHKLFTVRDLFRARVHLGHKMGSLHPRMAPFLFGSRFDSTVFDLDKTAFHLRQALNFLAHVAYRKGIILWVIRSPHAIQLVENTAIECGEYAHCREWDVHTLTNSTRKFGGITRLPDTIVLLSTLDTILARHLAVSDAAKMLIPTVGIVDSNCDPNLITYPVPGNDDSLPALQLYCSLFKEAILRGKNKRKQVDAAKAMKDNSNVGS